MDSVVDTLQGRKGMCALVREYAAYLRDAQSTNSGTPSQSADEDVSPLAFNAVMAPVATGRRGKAQSQRSLLDITLSTDISEYHLARQGVRGLRWVRCWRWSLLLLSLAVGSQTSSATSGRR
jgi:hypothetical protein